MSDTPKAGDLHTTLATWLYYLDQAGHRAQDDRIAKILERMSSIGTMQADMLTAAEQQDYATAAAIKAQLGSGKNDPDALGQELVAAVETSLDGSSAESVFSWAQTQLGSDHVRGDFGDDRESRTQTVRQAAFQTGLPWVAQIIDRFPNGEVGAHWVMVERVTDHVRCLDPYPWDDIDEEVEVPLSDFMVKWELSGCAGIRWA
jgi:hypothetical protein